MPFFSGLLRFEIDHAIVASWEDEYNSIVQFLRHCALFSLADDLDVHSHKVVLVGDLPRIG